MTNGEKMVWAALYAQALTTVDNYVVEEAANIATTQLNDLRAYVKGLDASDPAAISYTAMLVLE